VREVSDSAGEADFYLPHQDNDGHLLWPEIVEAELELFNRFDGWTIVGVVKGMYRKADRSPAFDECNHYEVVTDSSRIDEVKEIVLHFKAATSQESMYFEIERNSEVNFL